MKERKNRKKINLYIYINKNKIKFNNMQNTKYMENGNYTENTNYINYDDFTDNNNYGIDPTNLDFHNMNNINDLNNINSMENPSYFYTQEQSMLSKQIVEQKIDLEYNIDFMGRALSKAEIYAFRFGDQNLTQTMEPKFGFYNRFNSGYENNQKDLFKSLINAVKFVDYAFEETETEFGEILFPKNMSKEEVIKYIELLCSCLKHPKEKAIYNDLIRVIKRKESNLNKYDNLYDQNATMDPKKMMEVYPELNKAIEHKELNWKQNIENNPGYMPEFQIGKTFEDDAVFNDYNNKKMEIDYDNK